MRHALFHFTRILRLFEARISLDTAPLYVAQLNNHTAPMEEIEKHIRIYLEYLEIEKNASKLTIRNYKFYLKRFLDWLSLNQPQKIDLR